MLPPVQNTAPFGTPNDTKLICPPITHTPLSSVMCSDFNWQCSSYQASRHIHSLMKRLEWIETVSPICAARAAEPMIAKATPILRSLLNMGDPKDSLTRCLWDFSRTSGAADPAGAKAANAAAQLVRLPVLVWL